MGEPMSDFENILETMNSKSNTKNGTANKRQQGNGTTKSNTIPTSDTIFEMLKNQNNDLNLTISKITDDISNVKATKMDALQKNLTFSMVFSAIEVSIKEYEYQAKLFEEYSKLYDEMCNEENIVRILDLLRLIITDRRMILNDIINNLLKLQRLDNDRIKMDAAIGDEDSLGDLLSPESL